MQKDEKLLTINEVIELAGISRNTLYRDSKSGKINAIHFGKSVRFKQSEVDDYVESKKNSSFANYHRKNIKGVDKN